MWLVAGNSANKTLRVGAVQRYIAVVYIFIIVMFFYYSICLVSVSYLHLLALGTGFSYIV